MKREELKQFFIDRSIELTSYYEHLEKYPRTNQHAATAVNNTMKLKFIQELIEVNIELSNLVDSLPFRKRFNL